MKYLLLLLLGLLAITTGANAQQRKSPLAGKVICLDAGHGGTALTDSYRVGPTGEREEWVNLRVALLLQKLLQEKGATVLMTRTTDDNVPFDDRIKLALENKAQVFLSIHHNATADSSVNFPIIYYHGYASENTASVALAKHIAKALRKQHYQAKVPVSIVSDHAIFPTAGAKVLRGTYGIPAVIAEASFFTHAPEEERLKKPDYNGQEAKAYVAALEDFFRKPAPVILPKNSLFTVPPFPVFQEAERMGKIAKGWHKDYTQALQLMKHKKDTMALRQAYDLFTRSVKSFPDSYVAGDCHRRRAKLLQALGKKPEAKLEAIRAKEFYVRKK
ncbi:cell wall hydrolase [Rufibacter radiotolerans]|uniref:N-acetylmuramoyl-L-alanine amidase n=1 Tax=Rufibacter radiotolerans TaxID=1379910 RepID=A0A0H4W397_9BACT|nr:N-acetylmuramoyl-L-alanine amidase [Rufibacter radiotolerans]AKQ44921.1 cell wall hydrolase [Rufibacter radiotolerans]